MTITMAMMALTLVTFITLIACCCADTHHKVNRLLLLDVLPEGISKVRPSYLHIRTNYSGYVRVMKSDNFRVILDISGVDVPSVFSVQASLSPLTEPNGPTGLLLQVNHKEASTWKTTLIWVAVTVFSLTIILTILAILFVIAWYNREFSEYTKVKRHTSTSNYVEVDKSADILQVANLPHFSELSVYPSHMDADRGRQDKCNIVHMQNSVTFFEGGLQRDCENIEMVNKNTNDDGIYLSTKDQNNRKNKSDIPYIHADNALFAKDDVDCGVLRSFSCNKGQHLRSKTLPNGDGGNTIINSNSHLDINHEADDMDCCGSADYTLLVSACPSLLLCNDDQNTCSQIDSGEGMSLHNSDPFSKSLVASPKIVNGKIFNTLSTTFSSAKEDEATLSKCCSRGQKFHAISIKSLNRQDRGIIKSFSQPAYSRKYLPSQHLDISSRLFADIPEDPLEDKESVRSEMTKSLYGSSEIFNVNVDNCSYINLQDPDIDLPPMYTDDSSQDDDLAIGSFQKLINSKVCHGDIFFRDLQEMSLDKELPSPFSMMKPRPSSSIIPAKNVGLSDGLSDNPPTQLLPLTHQHALCESFGINQKDIITASMASSALHEAVPKIHSELQSISGQYATLSSNCMKFDGSVTQTEEIAGKCGYCPNNRPFFIATITNLTIISALSIVTLMSCVNPNVLKMLDREELVVNITVFSPTDFLSARNGTVFFNVLKRTHFQSAGDFHFDVYETFESTLMTPLNMCTNSSCQNERQELCDEQTGGCMCRKGYRRFNNRCLDINECAEGLIDCHPYAGCLNKQGSYDCVCTGDYFGDGRTCYDCNSPCKENQYEVQPCSETGQKICKDCTAVCPSGYYMALNCTKNENVVCRVCHPECIKGQYEYRICSTAHDRMCKYIAILPAIQGSSNVILEEDREIIEAKVIIDDLNLEHPKKSTYILDRGTSLYVRIIIHHVEALQKFIPRNVGSRSSVHQLPLYLASPAVQKVCPYPVPGYYKLLYTEHKNMTYQVNDTGHVVPCYTYMYHGQFPTEAVRKNDSILCDKTKFVKQLFSRFDDFSSSIRWVEQTKRCHVINHNCNHCIRGCAQKMVIEGDSDCAVIIDGTDNDWSPRLQLCYDCCVQKTCVDACKNVHRRRCLPERCFQGTIYEISLLPIWNSETIGQKTNRFSCHIEPMKQQRLLEFSYVVYSGSHEEIYSSSLAINSGEIWDTTGHMIHGDNVLKVEINSSLDILPDFIEGQIRVDGEYDLTLGNYRKDGQRLDSYAAEIQSFNIHPLPFSQEGNKSGMSCGDDWLKEWIHLKVGQRSHIANHHLSAEMSGDGSASLVVTQINRTPSVTIKANHSSLLAGIFPHVMLSPDSLSGKMERNNSHWLWEVSARVAECPGFLRIWILDSAYPHSPLFSADVAVLCPKQFTVKFSVPSGDAWSQPRQVKAVVQDANTVHHCRLYHTGIPRPETMKNVDSASRDNSSSTGPQKVHDSNEMYKTSIFPFGIIFSVQYMVVVGGAIFLLVCLLVIGNVVQPGVPPSSLPNPRCRDAIVMVIYTAFSCFSSLVFTFSVIFFVIMAVISPRFEYLTAHSEQSSTLWPWNQIELSLMQTHLRKELQRHHRHLQDVRSRCFVDMTEIIADMNKMHKMTLNQTSNVYERLSLQDVFEQIKHSSVKRLIDDLTAFRERYDRSVRSALSVVNSNTRHALSSVFNSTWLAGARFLHGVVATHRRHINNMQTPSFIDWAGFPYHTDKLTAGMTSLPPVPELADFKSTINAHSVEPTTRSQGSVGHTRTNHLYNRWFSFFSQNTSFDADWPGGILKPISSNKTWNRFSPFTVLFTILVGVDVALVIHRLLKAKSMAQFLLYGFPEYVDVSENYEEGPDDVFEDEHKCSVGICSSFWQAFKVLLDQLLNSNLVPKAVMTVAAGLIIYVVITLSSTCLTVPFLHKVGFLHNSEDYLDRHVHLVNGRIHVHASMINTVLFPACQAWMSNYIQRHKFAFQVYQRQLRHMQDVHSQAYCHYLKVTQLPAHCTSQAGEGDVSDMDNDQVLSIGCKFEPVHAEMYHRTNYASNKQTVEQLEMLLQQIHSIVFDICQVVVLFLSIIIVKELFCAVIWVLLRRSGFVRIRVIYEANQEDFDCVED